MESRPVVLRWPILSHGITSPGNRLRVKGGRDGVRSERPWQPDLRASGPEAWGLTVVWQGDERPDTLGHGLTHLRQAGSPPPPPEAMAGMQGARRWLNNASRV